MRYAQIQQFIAAICFCIAAQTSHAEDSWKTHYFTNETVIANSQEVISALQSGQSEAKIKSLIGSEVAFQGGTSWPDGGTNITLVGKIIVRVEWQPAGYYWRSPGNSHVEILGTLKSVDFQQHVIYIKAKAKNIREDWTL